MYDISYLIRFHFCLVYDLIFLVTEIHSSTAEFVKAVGKRYNSKQLAEDAKKEGLEPEKKGDSSAAAGGGGQQSSGAAGKSGGIGLAGDGHYAECYPGGMEEYDATYDSDEDVDFSKMDMVSKKEKEGERERERERERDCTYIIDYSILYNHFLIQGNKKGPVKRWDFDNEEDYSSYQSTREALPRFVPISISRSNSLKPENIQNCPIYNLVTHSLLSLAPFCFRAAFQYGVKMSEGRKTRRFGGGMTGKAKEKAKLNREWQQISAVRPVV